VNQIEELIEKLCPDGVPFHKIDDLISYEQPTPYLVESIEYDDSFTTPVLTAGQTFILGYTNEKSGIYQASVSSPVIIFDDFTTASKWVDFAFKAKSSAMKMLKPKDSKVISLKYFWYYLPSIEIDVSQHTRYWISKFSNEKIAVPPIEVQNEIVKILDTFLELEEELKAELEARKKQYSFYRFKLVDNNKSKTVRLKDLTEATFWIMPSTPTYDELEGIPYITSKNLSKGSIDYKGSKRISQNSYDEITKNRPIKEDDLLIGMIGTIGEIARVRETDLPFYGQNMYLVRFDQKMIDINYFLHYFDSELMKDYFNSIKNNSAQGYLKAEHIDNISIPLPTLSKQKEIAGILDIYSQLLNDIDVGIPGELKSRRQQYEYYRGKLLEFKELESA